MWKPLKIACQIKSCLPVAAQKPVKLLGLLAVLGNMLIATSLFSTSSSSLISTWYRQLHLSFSETYASVSLVQSGAAVWFRGSLGITYAAIPSRVHISNLESRSTPLWSQIRHPTLEKNNQERVQNCKWLSSVRPSWRRTSSPVTLAC